MNERMVQQLYEALALMYDWAAQISEEALDGDPDFRKNWAEDRKFALSVMQAYQERKGAIR